MNRNFLSLFIVMSFLVGGGLQSAPRQTPAPTPTPKPGLKIKKMVVATPPPTPAPKRIKAAAITPAPTPAPKRIKAVVTTATPTPKPISVIRKDPTIPRPTPKISVQEKKLPPGTTTTSPPKVLIPGKRTLDGHLTTQPPNVTNPNPNVINAPPPPSASDTNTNSKRLIPGTTGVGENNLPPNPANSSTSSMGGVVQPAPIDPGQLLIFTNETGLATSSTNSTSDVKISLKSSADVSEVGCNMRWQIPSAAMNPVQGTVKVKHTMYGPPISSFPVTIPAKQTAVTFAYKFPKTAQLGSYSATVVLNRNSSSSQAGLNYTRATSSKLHLPTPGPAACDLTIVSIETKRDDYIPYTCRSTVTIKNIGKAPSTQCLLRMWGDRIEWTESHQKVVHQDYFTWGFEVMAPLETNVKSFQTMFQPLKATINFDHEAFELGTDVDNNNWTCPPDKVLPDPPDWHIERYKEDHKN